MQHAGDAATRAVSLARAEPGTPALPATLEQLGFVRIYQGRHTDAIVAAKEALAHTPTFGNAHSVWGLAP
jgi:hypothetical protein